MEPHWTKTFADWLRQVFDHPVKEPEWYWDIDADSSEPSPPECVSYLTRLFEEPESALAPYSDGQIGQGLWYLVSNTGSNHMFSLVDPDVSWPQLRQGIRSIAVLFDRLFAKRCSECLSHLDEPGGRPLNPVCYMWWDLFPTFGTPENPSCELLDAELLGVMKLVLGFDSIACQESALHGLGHWQLTYPEVVQQAIDEFLATKEGRRRELLEYAERARVGDVL
jgi:hypothetical protein